ncbi:MAG TPA: amidohydrolase family protein [Acetobacteraceae bacterium]|nr:amidohydrolase family protein [Acetobacteraceae bacterium]
MDAVVSNIAGAIDVDVHPAVPRRADLLPFLDDVWRETMLARDIDVLDLTSYPPNAPLSARPDWRLAPGEARDPQRMARDVLDPFGLRHAILNCLSGGLVVYNEHIGTTLCRATNDWIAKSWLDADPRLRASIVVSLVNPETAAEEVERLAHDKRFVQVMTLAAGELPLGRKVFWPIYRAAERHGLPIAIHAGSGYRHATTQSGYPSTLAEDYAGQPQSFASQIVSLIAEGVFAKFPTLRFVLLESGVTWLPSLMWRMSKDWRGVRTEVPWVKQPPAWLMREHLRVACQPLDAPPDEVARIVEHLGSDEMLLFATDYPHWHFDGGDALPRGLPDGLRRKMLVENALATYPRLEATT